MTEMEGVRSNNQKYTYLIVFVDFKLIDSECQFYKEILRVFSHKFTTVNLVNLLL